nr:MAG TPA: hypothetical protein [Caudoviricetes sp.]
MKTAKLIIGDKEIAVQLTDEQVKGLTASEKVTGFERRYNCFYIDSYGDIVSDFDEGYPSTDRHYEVSNYYTDEKLAEWCCRSDTLTRRMRRWAAEHNPEPIDSYDTEPKWYLTCNIRTNTAEVHFNVSSIDFGKTFFKTKELAEAAIKEFGNEIKWLAENRPKWF